MISWTRAAEGERWRKKCRFALPLGCAYSGGKSAATCSVVRAPPPDELSTVLGKLPGIPYQVRMHVFRCLKGESCLLKMAL